MVIHVHPWTDSLHKLREPVMQCWRRYSSDMFQVAPSAMTDPCPVLMPCYLLAVARNRTGITTTTRKLHSYQQSYVSSTTPPLGQPSNQLRI